MNESTYRVVLIIAMVVAVLFAALVFFTGKGDAMSGGTTSIRTTYKGRATFDDQISKVTLYGGCIFMGLMLILDIIGSRVFK